MKESGGRCKHFFEELGTMGERTTRFLKISLVAVSLFCVVVFSVQAAFINMMGEDAIRRLGVFYMSGISEQVSSHFGTTIELRLSQVESLVDSVPPGRYASDRSMQTALVYHARSSGFEYLAFYTEDGDFHMLCGSEITADVPEALRRSVQGGHYNVCAGSDRQGTPIVLLGVPAVYPLENGEESIALVAGLPTRDLGNSLEENVQSGFMEYAIIRKDGSYVLHNSSALESENYFERAENLFEICDGKTPEQYVRELREALEAERDYTSSIQNGGKYWNVYCTSLPNSDWHLLLMISHNTLDETVNLLQQRWSHISIGGCVLIICALLLIFVGYYRLTKRQIRELHEARESAEQARQSAERSSRAKSEFLSNMSHDIRTPMNGIMGMTSVAMGSIDDPARVRSCLKKIHISSRHLLGMINDMLDMSKIESGKLTLNIEPVSLREIIQTITTIIQPQVQEKNQQFYIYVHNVYYENVCSDRVRLSQILLNVLGNAVKFTPEGGVIEVGLYEEPSPRGDGYIRSHLHVKDNGIGMSKDFLSRIFEPFTREDNARVAKEAGAGMGLPITKYIVDAMGGTITVESKQGKGSHFHIAVDMEKSAVQEKEMRLAERNVLVIDDDKTAARLAVAALDSIGLHGERAADLTQAAEMLEEQKNGPYHILLLDWDIQGQDGLRAAGELSERFGLPAALLTDGEWDELEAKSQESSVSSFISKPLFRSGLYYGLRPLIESETPVQEPDQENDLDLAGRRILMAEDNELNGEIASEMLQEFGLEVDWVVNGQLCAEKFEASDPGWYDAILMDLRMPIMTGYEAATAIRASNREDARTIPIIAVSADAFKDDIQKCLDCGMNAHTAKPFNVQKVLSLLNEYLR